ncbi:hypothetical protein V1511DRAFT_409734 [Dipodascopsis uninucleata]
MELISICGGGNALMSPENKRKRRPNDAICCSPKNGQHNLAVEINFGKGLEIDVPSCLPNMRLDRSASLDRLVTESYLSKNNCHIVVPEITTQIYEHDTLKDQIDENHNVHKAHSCIPEMKISPPHISSLTSAVMPSILRDRTYQQSNDSEVAENDKLPSITHPKRPRIIYTMGYRSDCDKCKARVSGHYSHIILSNK